MDNLKSNNVEVGRKTYENVERTPMVCVVGEELADETLRILRKEKLFPKKSRWLIAMKIADLANEFADTIEYANSLNASTISLATERMEEQEKAWALLKTLNRAMERARRVNDFEPENIKNWARLYNQEAKLLSGWKASEKKRLSMLIEKINKQ